MDKLANRLREDADRIEVAVSPELDVRIQASLQGVKQESKSQPVSAKPAAFWWASSLTGVAAAMAVLAIVNLNAPPPEIAVTEPPLQQFAIPQFSWKPKTAMLTETLEEELENIQSDLKKAERSVRDDIEDVL